MIIKPYSSVEDATFNASDYPACKLFLKFNDAAGTSIADAVSGSNLTAGAAFTAATNGITYTSTGTGAIAIPSTVTVGTKSALLVVVANLSAFSFAAVGAGSTNYMTVSALAGSSVSDGTDTATCATPTASAILGHGIAVVPGTSNEGTSYQSSTTVWTAPTTASATAGDLASMPDITHITNITSAVGAATFYGMALFVFDNGLPGDVKAAIAWMTARWQAGTKAIYPGWKGLA